MKQNMAKVAAMVAALGVTQSTAAEVSTPVAKVLELLEGMKENGEKETAAEKEQFTKYKDWCQKEIADKEDAIEKNEDDLVVAKADISTLSSSANNLQQQISKLDAEVLKWGSEIESTKTQRASGKKAYEDLSAEYAQSVEALEKAVDEIKAGKLSAEKGAALLEIDGGSPSADKITAFLSAYSVVEADPEAKPAYSSATGRVLKMLEKLKGKFVDEQAAAKKSEEEEVSRVEALLTKMEESVTSATETSKQKLQDKAKALQDSGDKKAEVEETVSTRDDNKKYLAQVSSTCKSKASDFDERSKLRKEELETLGKAIELISKDTVGKTAARQTDAALLQSKRSKTALIALWKGLSPKQERAAKYLAEMATKLDSSLLSTIALKTGQDPMEKVETMIKNLITKLENETGLDKDQQEWCDKEMGVNEKARTKQTSLIEKLTLEIETSGEDIDKFGEQIQELTKQLADNAASLAEQSKTRVAESTSNKNTISDAKDAQKALTNAISVLKEFYEKAKTSTAFVQKDAASTGNAFAEAPDIFESAYTGNSESSSVVGLLSTILSDFANLETSTAATEKTSQDDFDTMTSDSRILKAQQESDLTHKKSKKTETEEAKANMESDLASSKKELSAAMAYFDKLKDSCTAEGSVAEAREKRRKEEIQSLEEALKMLKE
eukprot:TRINITY_DN63991_c0_g1_i1.p1 TRINITY_DN63991_c0_g1~~TRINITY_DN63991_c0_g1_i1.p1  ORF type:complete len:669 (+),score=226.54 TRINITY_DN63991_c0_g1_i1:93-2099(+)